MHKKSIQAVIIAALSLLAAPAAHADSLGAAGEEATPGLDGTTPLVDPSGYAGAGMTGACCFPDGSCAVLEATTCLAQGGDYQGDGSECSTTRCPEPTGACCFPDGSCTIVTQQTCDESGGFYQGDESTCPDIDCPQPKGACCLESGSCFVVEEEVCLDLAGSFQGAFTICAQIECPQPPGGCCFADGSCTVVTQQTCLESGGLHQGAGTACSEIACPQPKGACCLQDGSCAVVEEAVCLDLSGSFQGAFTICAQIECPQPPGGCCFADGSCTVVTQQTCLESGGLHQGAGTACSEIACPQPKGACCLQDGSCAVVEAAVCFDWSGSFQGAFTICAQIECPQPPGGCCFADGSCTVVTQQACLESGGLHQGAGTVCQPGLCGTLKGACCFPDGSCAVLNAADCAAGGGTYQGDSTVCLPNPCAEPGGACCLPDGSCVEGPQMDCSLMGGGFQGAGTACEPGLCGAVIENGACCFPDGLCGVLTAVDCTAGGGTYQGDDTFCVPGLCTAPQGSCCFTDGTCSIDTQADCVAAGGIYQGDGTTCDGVFCGPAPGESSRGSASEKASLLTFSKVEVRWDAEGTLVQDTFVDLSNDYPEDVQVLMYFVNGDAPTAQIGQPGDADFERAHPGWNWVDNQIMLTKNEPTYWSALTGQPKGVSPLTVLDPGDPPGRPAMDGSGDRVLRGSIVAWAVNGDGSQIRWNHLKGDVTIVNYRDSYAWEYGAWSFPAVAGAQGDVIGDPGTLLLDGVHYAAAFDQLLVDFYASGATLAGALVDGDLTLHPASVDLRQETEGPVTTKASFDIWNMNEVKFSGTDRCVTCWDQTLLSNYATPNHFLVWNLQTTKGKARIDGLESILCDDDPIMSEDAALLGVIARFLERDGSFSASATNPIGLGEQPATIRFDPLDSPPEAHR